MTRWRARPEPFPDLWRALVPISIAAVTLLLVTSAVTARGTDLRPSSTVPVAQRIQQAEQLLAQLTKQEDALRAQISSETASAAAGDARVRSAQAAANALEDLAGLRPVAGSEVTVSLNDAPKADQQRDEQAGAQPDDLVIHQQDVQGVVNALWSGGARAMAIMGQRVVSTTAVRCVGNTLLLHGRVYGPPFVISAIGDPAALRNALNANPDVAVFQQYVAAYGLGYKVTTKLKATLPPYDGPLEFSHAKAMQ